MNDLSTDSLWEYPTEPKNTIIYLVICFREGNLYQPVAIKETVGLDDLSSTTLMGVPGFELISTRRGGDFSTLLCGRDRDRESSLSEWLNISIEIDSSPFPTDTDYE